jgi:DNA-binding response OmpR family regulator
MFGGGMKFLIVEDEAVTASYLHQELVEEGYIVERQHVVLV